MSSLTEVLQRPSTAEPPLSFIYYKDFSDRLYFCYTTNGFKFQRPNSAGNRQSANHVLAWQRYGTRRVSDISIHGRKIAKPYLKVNSFIPLSPKNHRKDYRDDSEKIFSVNNFNKSANKNGQSIDVKTSSKNDDTVQKQSKISNLASKPDQSSETLIQSEKTTVVFEKMESKQHQECPKKRLLEMFIPQVEQEEVEELDIPEMSLHEEADGDRDDSLIDIIMKHNTPTSDRCSVINEYLEPPQTGSFLEGSLITDVDETSTKMENKSLLEREEMTTTQNGWMQDGFTPDKETKRQYVEPAKQEYRADEPKNAAIIENYTESLKVSEFQLNQQFLIDNDLKFSYKKPPKYADKKSFDRRKSKRPSSGTVKRESPENLNVPPSDKSRPGSCIPISSLTLFDELLPNEDRNAKNENNSPQFASNLNFRRPNSAHSETKTSKAVSKTSRLSSRAISGGVSIPQSVRGYESSKNIPNSNCFKIQKSANSLLTTITFGSELSKNNETWKCSLNAAKNLNKKHESTSFDHAQKNAKFLQKPDQTSVEVTQMEAKLTEATQQPVEDSPKPVLKNAQNLPDTTRKPNAYPQKPPQSAPGSFTSKSEVKETEMTDSEPKVVKNQNKSRPCSASKTKVFIPANKHWVKTSPNIEHDKTTYKVHCQLDSELGSLVLYSPDDFNQKRQNVRRGLKDTHQPFRTRQRKNESFGKQSNMNKFNNKEKF